ncbi:hypothetical protein, partial [Bradyrhizobium valentinum]
GFKNRLQGGFLRGDLALFNRQLKWELASCGLGQALIMMLTTGTSRLTVRSGDGAAGPRPAIAGRLDLERVKRGAVDLSGKLELAPLTTYAGRGTTQLQGVSGD